MAEFVGPWNITTIDNMTEFLGKMDTAFWRKQLMKFATSSVFHITRVAENKWTFKTKIGPLGVDQNYEIGVETSIENWNGEMIKSTLSMENEKKFIISYNDPKYDLHSTRTVDGDDMKDEMTCNGVKASITYKRKR